MWYTLYTHLRGLDDAFTTNVPNLPFISKLMNIVFSTLFRVWALEGIHVARATLSTMLRRCPSPSVATVMSTLNNLLNLVSLLCPKSRGLLQWRRRSRAAWHRLRRWSLPCPIESQKDGSRRRRRDSTYPNSWARCVARWPSRRSWWHYRRRWRIMSSCQICRIVSSLAGLSPSAPTTLRRRKSDIIDLHKVAHGPA